MAGHIQTRNDGQCLKRWTLLDEYKKAKRPVKYGKSTKLCKLRRCQDLIKMVKNQLAEEERNKDLVKDPDLVILVNDQSYTDSLEKVEENIEYITNIL